MYHEYKNHWKKMFYISGVIIIIAGFLIVQVLALSRQHRSEIVLGIFWLYTIAGAFLIIIGVILDYSELRIKAPDSFQ
ncbi:MAG: hypothetical protein ACFFEW_18385 [Candidatus Thorarchaeota archaeon]